ncbi:WbqC family protein [Candidatus Protochlamydia sp. W-9]|uniref:WbqC family protein n=1 Tax=Candidatus Protochlamydia sp. W-9 TaxID=1785087 RepID=UPI00096A8BE4|nr:WbqC family protein [Candidatus Protochlamydia sp. W-9]
MRVSIHQPEHMPWRGFFQKMAKSDLCVVLDCVQYTKNNWQNRNQFCTPKGKVFWLSVPVRIKGHLNKTIREMEIDYSNNWINKYWKTLKMNYSKTPFFTYYAPKIKAILESQPIFLWKLNTDLINLFREDLNICNDIIFASELNPTGNKTELILDICKKVKATTYISGQGGMRYLDLNLFSKHGIHVEFNHVQPKNNILPNFINLSFGHTLFHFGKEAKTLL